MKPGAGEGQIDGEIIGSVGTLFRSLAWFWESKHRETNLGLGTSPFPSLSCISPIWTKEFLLNQYCVHMCVCVCGVPLIKHLCSLKMCSSTDRDFLFLLSIFLLSNYLPTLPTNVYCAHSVCQTVGVPGEYNTENLPSWSLGSREGREMMYMWVRSLGSEKC